MCNRSVSQVLFLVFWKVKNYVGIFRLGGAVGSNDLFDAAWLVEADVGFLHPGYDDFSGANFSGGSIIFIVDNRVPRINSNITSLINGRKEQRIAVPRPFDNKVLTVAKAFFGLLPRY
jgi:hypothetical protein